MKTEIITSRQNPLCKLVLSLGERKNRQETRLFRFDGLKLFLEAVLRGVEIEKILVSDRAGERIFAETDGFCGLSDRVFVLSESVFSKISEENSPEGIITVAKYIDKSHKIVTIDSADVSQDGTTVPPVSEKILAAESLRDPGNLGTIIRSCAALGMDRLVITSDCADIYNPKTVRAAMGALFSLRIDTVSCGLLPEYIRLLAASGRRALAASAREGARDISGLEISRGDFFVIGNEGHGLSEGTLSACSESVMIPMRGGCESLNAAGAAAIFIWETVKSLR